MEPLKKRGRGRPKGSVNKPKMTVDENGVELPASNLNLDGKNTSNQSGSKPASGYK